MKPETDIRYLKGVGERRAELLAKLGISTVGQLLRFYPRHYEDWSKIVRIADAPDNEECCIRAIVDTKPAVRRLAGGRTLFKTDITDGQSIMQLNIFNNKYAADALEEGAEYLFFGKVSRSGFFRSMNNPTIEKATSAASLRPIYPQTAGLNSRAICKLMKTALDACSEEIAEPLPTEVREAYCLCSARDAIRQIHFPDNNDLLSEARRRLIFEELMLLQLGLMLLKGRGKAQTGHVAKNDYTDEFISLLPFKPTNAQLRAIKQGVTDMAQDRPMNRLLQGDVGSGKTAVAAALIYNAAKNGLQSALMAPTEILARQHFNTLSGFFEGTKIKPALLLGSTKAAEKRTICSGLESGEIPLVIGTHAVIQGKVSFNRLGLAVTDEQHRFGVEQRRALGEKGENPHTLVMSATPIPRTLALIIYGDLDISVLDELPVGRVPVETYSVGSDKRTRALKYVKNHLDAGMSGYIVCPMIEEGDAGLTAATEYYENLSKGFFAGYPLGLLHGKMKPAEKESVMSDFVSGKTRLLVATTVIEVGVDVPQAVIMVIENAERFGLSQLHQLRGRIGRGSQRSTCILISDAQNKEAVRRLDVIAKTSDGFKIADEDLKLRGPGDFFGARQHGLPELKIADMLTDTAILRETGDAARKLLASDAHLAREENLGLRAAVTELFASGGAMN